jgi:hypothetical protein
MLGRIKKDGEFDKVVKDFFFKLEAGKIIKLIDALAYIDFF